VLGRPGKHCRENSVSCSGLSTNATGPLIDLRFGPSCFLYCWMFLVERACFPQIVTPETRYQPLPKLGIFKATRPMLR
jgi:hypothetical protein